MFHSIQKCFCCNLKSVFVLTILQLQFSFSQEDIRFKRITIEDGLSQSTVETIVQDQSGFLWFGTEDGLNRYDGYQFRIYKHNPDDPHSISNNDIWCLFVDENGFLWVGTYTGGLNRYSPQNETFTRFVNDPSDPGSISSNNIRSITQDADGNLWIGTQGGGLNRYETEKNRFTKLIYDPNNPNSLNSNNVRFVYPDSDNVLWIATSNGLCAYDIRKNIFTRYYSNENNSNSLIDNNVRHILEDRFGIFWISTENGLSRLDPRKRQVTNYVHNPNNPFSISSNNIRKVHEDSHGRLWIATTQGGLNLFNRGEERFYTYLNNPVDPNSLSNNSLRVIFEDRGGLVWLGTFGGGLNVYDPKTDRFRRYRHDPGNLNSLSDPIVWAISQGPDGDIWFGNNSGNLDCYNRKTGEYVVNSNYLENNLGKDRKYIRSLYWDDMDRLWIGGHNGVDCYDPVNESYRHFHHNPGNPDSLSNNNVRTIYQDGSGSLWFCTWGGGLDRYDPTTGTFTNFRHQRDNPNSLSNDNVISILQDNEGNYWVATSDGLNRLISPIGSTNLTSPRPRWNFARFYHDPSDLHSLSNSYVLSIHEARNGDLWVGTMLGLSRLRKEDRSKPAFTRYFMKNGLPNDVVYGILEDSRGNLWLSTNNGLSRFDPHTETFKNYDIRDGLQSHEFNSGAYTRTVEGTFIFGGVNGATEFHPDSLKDNPYLASIVLTGFYIFDKPAKLNQAISATEEIILSYQENYFSFEFSSLDFSIPERNRYAYKLEGLDEDWVNSGSRHFASYTGVDPGEYVFKVKGTNEDGVWNDAGTSVRIIITPPFWRTWWFVLLLFLTFVGGIAFLISYRVRRLLEIERLRSKIAADLHDDIGAGLTEISIMGEVINQKLPKSSQQLIFSEIQKIGATSRGLIDNMSDIVWLVNPRRDSLYDLISRLGDSYTALLESTNIQFKTQNLDTLKNVRLSMEYRQHLFLIFKEAITNSLKYSQATEIFLKVALKGKKLTMRLIDNGQGFDTRNALNGNGLANMTRRAELIKGTLKIESIIEKGTEIEFEGNIS